MTRIPPAPAEHPGTASSSCDWGGCESELVAWRWSPHAFQTYGDWLPVCRKHAKGRVAWPTPAQCKAAGQPYRRPTPKPKGLTRTQLRKRADDLWREIIRSEGKCCARGWVGKPCSDKIQAAHIVSRKYDGTRWMIENGLALCERHHLTFTHDELIWEIFRDEEVGYGLYEALRHRALTYKGPPAYERIIASLEAYRSGVSA